MIFVDLKVIDDRIDERLNKRLRETTTPGKTGAVFILYVNGTAKGTTFAVDEYHVITSRHNMYKPSENINIGDQANIQSNYVSSTSSSTNQVITGAINVHVIDGGANTGLDSEDWLLLKRTDNEIFRNFIIVRVTTDIKIKQTLPYITIYHFPLDFSSLESKQPFMDHANTRVIDVQDGHLICNDKCTVTGGSCGAPYVENASSNAIGLHILGTSATNKVAKSLESAIQDRPYGLHFAQGSTVVLALQKYDILKP